MDAARPSQPDSPNPLSGPPIPEPIRIGDRAVAASPLRPGGAVTVGGRRQSARTTGMLVESGAELVVVGSDNVGLLVVPAGLAASSIAEAERGAPVHVNFVGAVRADAAVAEERQRRFLSRRRRWIWNRSLAIGLGCGLIVVAICWMWPTLSWPSQPWQAGLLTLGTLLGFGAAAPWLAALLEERFGETDTNLRGLTLPTTFLMLLGVAVGGAWGAPRFGVLSGIGMAAIAAVILGSPLPALMFFAVAGNEEGPAASESSGAAGAEAGPPAST